MRECSHAKETEAKKKNSQVPSIDNMQKLLG